MVGEAIVVNLQYSVCKIKGNTEMGASHFAGALAASGSGSNVQCTGGATNHKLSATYLGDCNLAGEKSGHAPYLSVPFNSGPLCT